MSPVRKPFANFFRGAWRIGKPYASVQHRFRFPWPHALTSKGRIPSTPRCSGVLAPTQAASNQCVLGSPRVVRLNLVRPARPALDRQARRLEPTGQLPPRGVDRRGVREWGLGLAPDPLEDLRLLLQEDLDGPVPFATVAGLAGQGEVAHAVGATPALGVDVLDLERHVGLAAIRARAVPLLEQVLPQLVPGERALLVRDARDLGVLDLLEVELDQLLGRRGDRTEPKEPADPGQDVGDAAFEARREPTLPSRPVVEPRWAVARLAGAAASTEGPACLERRLDGLAPVLDLDRGDDPPCLLLDDGQAGRLRARVDLDPMLAPGGDVAPILEDDREGESPEDRRPPPLEQDPRRAIRHGVSGFRSRSRTNACIVLAPMRERRPSRGRSSLRQCWNGLSCPRHRPRPSVF